MKKVVFKDFANKLREISKDGFVTTFEAMSDGWFMLRITKDGRSVTRECHADDANFENIIEAVDVMVEDWKERFS